MRYAYYVHSDVNENNVFSDFYGRGAKQAAIAYAKRYADQETWVDRVEIDENDELTGDYETVWSYDDED